MEDGILGVDSLQGLEASAKQIARRMMNEAGIEDFSDVQNAVRQGALKVSSCSNMTIFPS